jgi:hypothetical protein
MWSGSLQEVYSLLPSRVLQGWTSKRLVTDFYRRAQAGACLSADRETEG